MLARFIKRLVSSLAILSLALPTHAGTVLSPKQLEPIFATPSWVLPNATLDLDFANQRYYLQGAIGTFINTRNSPATCIDSANNLIQVAAFQNCVAPGVGVGAWESRTNNLLNSSTVDSNTGFWTIGSNTTRIGQEQASIGTTATIYQGAGLSSSDYVAQSTTLSYGLTYTVSVDARLVSGVLPTSGSIISQETCAGGGRAANSFLGLTSAYKRFSVSFTATCSGAAATYLITDRNTTGQIGATIAQLELNPNLPASVASATAEQALTSATTNSSGSGYSNTSGTMTWAGTGCAQNPVLNVTYAAGVANVTGVSVAGACQTGNVMTGATWTPGGGITGGSGFTANVTLNNFAGFGASQTGTLTWSGTGCTVNPVINVTTGIGGGINTVNSVTTPGSCSTMPTSAPVATWIAGGGVTGSGTVALLLTPTDNSAQAFPTPPILTSGTAQTRLVDNISLPISGGYSVLAYGSTNVPNTSAQVQTLAELDSGSFSTLTQLARGTNGNVYCSAGVSGTFVIPVPSSPAWLTGTSKRLACLTDGANASVTFNGTGKTSLALAAKNNASFLRIGGQINGTPAWNGYISRVAVSSQSLLSQ